MIKIVSNPKLKDPIFIAAWTGMGEVAYRTVIFLREVMGFKLFAKLDAQEFFKPAAVIVENGQIELPVIPAGFFYYLKKKNLPDIILFLGEAQPPLEHAETFSIAIVDFIRRFKAKFIITFAAKPEPIDHKTEPMVWIAPTHTDVIKRFEKFNVKILKEGQISGLNGLILGVGKQKGIKGVCLLGEIPFYTVQIENPKATTNILKILDQFLGLNLNLAPMTERCKYIEEEIDKLVIYLKGEGQQGPAAPNTPAPLSEDDLDKIKKDLAAYTKLPQSAREKIDNLFKAAQSDIAQANTLKNELDRWNAYKEYEDRFLDLFKKDDKKDKPH
jgi:hypothetical protein